MPCCSKSSRAITIRLPTNSSPPGLRAKANLEPDRTLRRWLPPRTAVEEPAALGALPGSLFRSALFGRALFGRALFGGLPLGGGLLLRRDVGAGAARFAQRDGDGLFAALHRPPAAGFQPALLVLAHHLRDFGFSPRRTSAFFGSHALPSFHHYTFAAAGVHAGPRCARESARRGNRFATIRESQSGCFAVVARRFADRRRKASGRRLAGE